MDNKFPIQQETGDPKVSLENSGYLKVIHGPLVGAIHRITPTELQSTLLFFWDGHVHESLGFECGNMEEKAMAMKAVVQSAELVGSKIEGAFIAGMSKDKETVDLLQEGKTVCFILRAPTKNSMQLQYLKCNGAKSMDNAIMVLASDDSTMCFEPTDED